MINDIYRSRTDKVFTGLCGGLGEYFKMGSWVFRLLFILFGCSLMGIVVYFVLSYIIKESPYN